MNKIQINLENFQSIREAELEFIQGINLIIGEGNSGKSATLRAIKGAITNPKGSQKYITNGENSLSVNIQYLGNDITWSRTKKEIKYTVNGEEYQKVGNSNLAKILDKSGFVLDESDKLMNVEGELELPFPFDKNPADLFKLFEKSIFCVSDSALILKAIKADEDIVSEDKKTNKAEQERFSKKLKALEELEKDVDLDKLRKGKVDLEELFFQLEKLQNNYKTVVKGYKAAKTLKESKPEVTVPSLSDYKSLLACVNKLEGIKALVSVLKETKEPVQVDINCADLNKMKADYKRLTSIYNLFTLLKLEVHKEVTSVDVESYNKIKNNFRTLGKLVGDMKDLKQKIEKQQELVSQYKEQLSEFKVCPLCGHELKGDLNE